LLFVLGRVTHGRIGAIFEPAAFEIFHNFLAATLSATLPQPKGSGVISDLEEGMVREAAAGLERVRHELSMADKGFAAKLVELQKHRDAASRAAIASVLTVEISWQVCACEGGGSAGARFQRGRGVKARSGLGRARPKRSRGSAGLFIYP